MKHFQFIFIGFIFLSCLLLTGCGKHIYVLNTSELNRYAKEAMETSPQVFVVYANGDTLKGASIRKHNNVITGKSTWMLDDKLLRVDSIKAYQDQYGYRQGIYSRVTKGYISLYTYQDDDSRLRTSYSASKMEFKTDMTGGIHTSFYMGHGESIQRVTLNSLKLMMKNCPMASSQIPIEFNHTMWNKSPNENINDYRALIRILTLFNENNCR